jgi:hypothetical protein
MTDLERIGEFGDVRRAERGAWLFDRIVATGLWCCARSAATALVNAAAGQAPDFSPDSPALPRGRRFENSMKLDYTSFAGESV